MGDTTLFVAPSKQTYEEEGEKLLLAMYSHRTWLIKT